MNPSQLITNQIKETPDWRGELYTELRALINEAVPELEEGWKWGTAVWSHNGLVCAIGVFKEAVKVNFFQGASLKDPHKLFNAGLDAKKTRAIDFREGDKVPTNTLTELIQEATAFNG